MDRLYRFIEAWNKISQEPKLELYVKTDSTVQLYGAGIGVVIEGSLSHVLESLQSVFYELSHS